MLVYGKNVVEEILKKNNTIKKAYIYKEFHDSFILSSLQKRNICIFYKTKKELDELAKGNHQGIILDVPDFVYHTLDELTHDNSLLVMLDHIEDPHNLGAIIRTSEAAGVEAIILPKDRSALINSTVIKVSTGAIHNIKIVCVSNLNQTIQILKKKGYWFIGTDMNGEDYCNIDYKGNTCIVIGNEGKGMSHLVKENCDFIASIPMKGKVNSLNASVAAGIVIFEAIKNREKM